MLFASIMLFFFFLAIDFCKCFLLSCFFLVYLHIVCFSKYHYFFISSQYTFNTDTRHSHSAGTFFDADIKLVLFNPKGISMTPRESVNMNNELDTVCNLLI